MKGSFAELANLVDDFARAVQEATNAKFSESLDRIASSMRTILLERIQQMLDRREKMKKTFESVPAANDAEIVMQLIKDYGTSCIQSGSLYDRDFYANVQTVIRELFQRFHYQKEEKERLTRFLESARKRCSRLVREVRIAQDNNHRRNVELDALHYVWCDGGCKGGIHRYCELPPLTAEIVVSAERNAARLRRWYVSAEGRKADSGTVEGRAPMWDKAREDLRIESEKPEPKSDLWLATKLGIEPSGEPFKFNTIGNIKGVVGVGDRVEEIRNWILTELNQQSQENVSQGLYAYEGKDEDHIGVDGHLNLRALATKIASHLESRELPSHSVNATGRFVDGRTIGGDPRCGCTHRKSEHYLGQGPCAAAVCRCSKHLEGVRPPSREAMSDDGRCGCNHLKSEHFLGGICWAAVVAGEGDCSCLAYVEKALPARDPEKIVPAAPNYYRTLLRNWLRLRKAQGAVDGDAPEERGRTGA